MSRPINRMRPVHPGEILREDFLVPIQDERLARYFGGDAESWMSLQAAYDLKTLPTRDEIRKRVVPRAA